MRKLTVIATLITLLAAVVPAAANVEIWGDLYYCISPPAGPYNPTYGGSQWTWPVLYTNHATPIHFSHTTGTDWASNWASTGGTVDPLVGKILKKDSTLLLGLENEFVRDWVKYVTVSITLSDTSKILALGSCVAGGNSSPSICDTIKNVHELGKYIAIIRIRPQPDWEWITVKNISGSDVTFSSVAIRATCYGNFGIPSLTTWGLLILVLLLGGTAVWIVRKRKPAVSM